MKKIFILFILIGFANPLLAQTLTGKEILEKVDKNLVLDEAVSRTKMIVHGRAGKRTIESKSWVKGEEKAFVEYLSPPREEGKKMLKLGDKIWTYTPEPTDRIITISGHLLKQSVMGSDLSYEDMTENEKLNDAYKAEVQGKEIYEERECWVLKLTAIKDDVAYDSRKLWIDAERWLPLKQELYAKSGKLLKTIKVDEVFQQDSRWYPKKTVFKDMLKEGEGTEYIVDSIDFNVEIPEQKFTKAALRK